MRLYLYYACHAVWNNIRKLLRTWMLIFIIACMVMGGLIGVAMGMISERFEEETEPPIAEEPAPDEEEPSPDEEEPMSPEDIVLFTEAAVGVIGGIMVAIAVLGGRKSANNIFLPADVNLLFPSPMKPQSVLLFRLMMKIGASLLATLYLLIVLPTQMSAAGLAVGAMPSIFAAWLIALVYYELISVLIYTYSSTHRGVQRYLLTGVGAVLGVLFIGFFAYRSAHPELAQLQAVFMYLSLPATRAVPIVGWLRGFVVGAFEGNAIAFLYLAALLLPIPLLIRGIWRLRADFYEDALSHAAELEATMEAAAGNGVVKRQRDRRESIARNGRMRGSGAQVFFTRPLYDRFRMAFLHVFTKTTDTYLLAGIAVAAITRFWAGSHSVLPLALTFCALVWFRSLGNPIRTESDNVYFRMVPASPYAKVLYAVAAGHLCTLMDLLPAYLIGCLLVGASPLGAALWFFFILSIDLYSSNVGLFIDLSLPSGLSEQLKTLVQIFFVYFGLAPCAVLLVVGVLLGHLSLFLVLGCLLNVALAALFYAFSPLFIRYGGR